MSKKKFFQNIITLVLVSSFLMPLGVSAKEIEGDRGKTAKPAATVALSATAKHYDFEHSSLGDVVTQFRKEYGLTEKNFSMSYRLTDGTLKYNFEGDTLRPAASTYKLPLNMYYYDMERAGKISPKARIRGYSLDQMHRQSLVYSNNEVSHAMMFNLGTYRHYRELMAQFSEKKVTDSFYGGNVFTSAYMIHVLDRIYQNRDQYREMIGYMKEASPGQYFKRGNEDVVIAHKYGSYNGALNDVGIIYTDTPFLLAVYTQNVKNAEVVLGKIAGLMTEYTTYYLQVKNRPIQESTLQRAIKLLTLETHLTDPEAAPAEEQILREKAGDALRAGLIGIIFLWLLMPVVLRALAQIRSRRHG